MQDEKLRNTNAQEELMSKAFLLMVILVTTFISIECSEKKTQSIGPIFDHWKCPSCGWENSEDAMRCKICDRYK